MAAPIAAFIQLPVDTANTGKKNRTQTKVVGTDTVHEHFQVPSHAYTRTGRYILQTTGTAVTTSSQSGTGTGALWLQVSTAATGVVAAIRDIRVSYGVGGTVAADGTAPVLNFTKFTFNTAFSSTVVTAVLPYNTTAAAATATVCTTSSGATITLVRDVANFIIPALITTVGVYGGQEVIYAAGEEYNRMSALELAPGEGMVVYQSVAGSGADTRQWTARVVWDELSIS